MAAQLGNVLYRLGSDCSGLGLAVAETDPRPFSVTALLGAIRIHATRWQIFLICNIVLICATCLSTIAFGQTPPTATEEFNLRIKCKELADQKAEELDGMSRSAKWEILNSWHASKYDAKSNRCYVRVYGHMRHHPSVEHVIDQVYDAQVDDILASATILSGKKNGQIFDPDYKKPWLPLCNPEGCPTDFGDRTWQAAKDYMSELMADPRRQ